MEVVGVRSSGSTDSIFSFQALSQFLSEPKPSLHLRSVRPADRRETVLFNLFCEMGAYNAFRYGLTDLGEVALAHYCHIQACGGQLGLGLKTYLDPVGRLRSRVGDTRTREAFGPLPNYSETAGIGRLRDYFEDVARYFNNYGPVAWDAVVNVCKVADARVRSDGLLPHAAIPFFYCEAGADPGWEVTVATEASDVTTHPAFSNPVQVDKLDVYWRIL